MKKKPAAAKGIPIIGTLWVNHFEPNHGKSNRGSMWMTLLTLESTSTKTVDALDMCPMAAGPKGKDHQPVLCETMNDLKAPEERDDTCNFHNGITNTSINIHFELQVIILD